VTGPNWHRALETGEFTVGVYNIGRLANSPILPLVLGFRDQTGATGGVV